MGSIFQFFLLIIHGGLSAVTRVHIHVDESKNWIQAQSYCRENYKDLSTVSSTEENLHLRPFLGGNHAWIGMYRNYSNREQFIWSDGDLQTNFSQWKAYQPNPASDWQNCVEIDATGWADYTCHDSLPFFCYFIFESDNKTWDEALEQCTDHHADLASLTTNQQLQQVKNHLIGETSIWVGLRFVAGQWYWLNTEPVANEISMSLPECPDKPYRCGAFNIITEQWENRDCEEKLRFICF